MDYLKEELEHSRKILGISQEDIAKIMGINSKTYRTRLQDENSFSIEEIRKYVHYLEKKMVSLREYPTLQMFGTTTGLVKQINRELEEVAAVEDELLLGDSYHKLSNSYETSHNISSISQSQQKLLDNFLILDKADQKRIYEEIKKLASEKLDLSHLDEE